MIVPSADLKLYDFLEIQTIYIVPHDRPTIHTDNILDIKITKKFLAQILLLSSLFEAKIDFCYW